MEAPSWLLLLGCLSLFGSVAALGDFRRAGPLMILFFFTGWLQGELAVIHLIWQVPLALGLIAAGALSAPAGMVGLVALLIAWGGLAVIIRQSWQARERFRAALDKGLGGEYRALIPGDRQGVLRAEIEPGQWLRPFHMKRPGVQRLANIAYGDAGKRNLLDIFRPLARREGGYPVLLQIHGGGWILGSKNEQGQPLMHHLAERGWLCVAINYRLSPKATFPDHIIDVKKAIAWIKANIARYGGNPAFIAVTGGSAGGHLTALAALSANEPDWQPGFEEADTTVQAAVPFYGVYDWIDRYRLRGSMSMEQFLTDRVLKCTPEQNLALWESGSPVTRVRPDAPPFFVIHGDRDSMAWVEDARRFASALADQSAEPVVYAELPGGEHAFDVFHSIRCDLALNAVTEFLEWAHAQALVPAADRG